ncbi:MAG: extracellular solute-binding protein [Chloroflexota bacterium]
MDRILTRRNFLQGAAGVTAAASAGAFLAACGGSSATPAATAAATSAATAAPSTPASSGGPLNFLTWSDHWNQDALNQAKATLGITVNVSELSDNSDGFAKLKQVGGQLDMVSADALWVLEYSKNDLVVPFDLASITPSDGLYSISKSFEFFTAPGGYLAYPWGWSPIQIAFNPANVTTTPDSWQVLVDAKYKGRIVMENQPTDIMLMAARAIGAKDGYNMTDAELAQAKSFLQALKPNILKFSSQGSETIQALADGSAWLSTGNLGAEQKVKDAGGPAINTMIPKEGTIGFIDGEMLVKGAENAAQFVPYLTFGAQPEWVAQNFLDNGRPLFNEKAYKLLVDGGHKEQADRFLYNKPELALQMTLKGPGGRVQDYIDIFNSVFGA